jgi:hypothetical protein
MGVIALAQTSCSVKKGTSPNLTDKLGVVNLNYFLLYAPSCKKERFLGMGDATSLSGQFLVKADALPSRSSQQIQFIKFHQNFRYKYLIFNLDLRRIIWKNKDIKEPNLVVIYLTLAARPPV